MMSTLFAWQQEIWQKLMCRQTWHGHALLLKGKKGIGKFNFARLLAQSLLCANPNTQHTACGQCASCNWFEQQTHPNFMMIMPDAMTTALNLQIGSADHASRNAADSGHNNAEQSVGDKHIKKQSGQHITVDQIRGLDDFVYLSGHQKGYKIVLIYPAETMTIAAASALLKKLEEPPENTLFILVSHQFQRVLPTILSRCQQVVMPVPDTETATQWIIKYASEQPAVSKPEKLRDPQYVHRLLALSGFSPLSAFSLLDTIEQHQQFIEAVSSPVRFDPLSLARMLNNLDLVITVDWLQKWCYDMACFHIAGQVRYHPHWESQIRTLCERVNPKACLAYLQFLNARQALSRHPVNGRLFLEEMFIYYDRLLTSTSSELEFPIE